MLHTSNLNSAAFGAENAIPTKKTEAIKIRCLLDFQGDIAETGRQMNRHLSTVNITNNQTVSEKVEF